MSGFPVTQSPVTLVDCSGTVNAGLSSISVMSGGTGHAVGDVITIAGQATVTVLTASSGAITSVSIATKGSLSYQASLSFTNPATQVSSTGAGVGATFTAAWADGVPTRIITANARRSGIRIQNQSTTDSLWFNDIISLVSAHGIGSYGLSSGGLSSPGGYYEGPSTADVWVYASKPGTPFSAAWYAQ